MYDKILFPVDGSEVSTNAVKDSVGMVKKLGSAVRIIYVLDASMMAVPDPETGLVDISALRESFRAVGNSSLSEAEGIMKSAGVEVDTALIEGDVHEAILDEIDRWGADLVIMGTHGRRGFNRFLLGSVAESVARRAGCGVLLMRPRKES